MGLPCEGKRFSFECLEFDSEKEFSTVIRHNKVGVLYSLSERVVCGFAFYAYFISNFITVSTEVYN